MALRDWQTFHPDSTISPGDRSAGIPELQAETGKRFTRILELHQAIGKRFTRILESRLANFSPKFYNFTR